MCVLRGGVAFFDSGIGGLTVLAECQRWLGDGVYYYYNGKSQDKNVIYRVLVSDTSNPEIIHEIPNSDLSKTASLEMINGKVYIHYFCGSGPTMSTEYYYKTALQRLYPFPSRPQSLPC